MKDMILKGLTEALAELNGGDITDGAKARLVKLAESVEEKFNASVAEQKSLLESERADTLAGITRCLSGAYTHLVESRIEDILDVASNTELANVHSNIKGLMEASGYVMAEPSAEVLADERVKTLTESKTELEGKVDEAVKALNESDQRVKDLEATIRKGHIEALTEGVAADQQAKLLELFESVQGINLSDFESVKAGFLKDQEAKPEVQNLNESTKETPAAAKPAPKRAVWKA